MFTKCNVHVLHIRRDIFMQLSSLGHSSLHSISKYFCFTGIFCKASLNIFLIDLDKYGKI